MNDKHTTIYTVDIEVENGTISTGSIETFDYTPAYTQPYTPPLTPRLVGHKSSNVFRSGCAMLFIMVATGWLARMAWVAVTN